MKPRMTLHRPRRPNTLSRDRSRLPIFFLALAVALGWILWHLL